MNTEQQQLIAIEVEVSKKGMINSHYVAKRIKKMRIMRTVPILDIEAEILRICPNFNKL